MKISVTLFLSIVCLNTLAGNCSKQISNDFIKLGAFDQQRLGVVQNFKEKLVEKEEFFRGRDNPKSEFYRKSFGWFKSQERTPDGFRAVITGNFWEAAKENKSSLFKHDGNTFIHLYKIVVHRTYDHRCNYTGPHYSLENDRLVELSHPSQLVK